MNLKKVFRIRKRRSSPSVQPEATETGPGGSGQLSCSPSNTSRSPSHTSSHTSSRTSSSRTSRTSPISPSPAFYPCGIKTWYDCPNATVDICFVHGLGGDRDATWTAKGQANPWPQTLLPDRLKTARILTFGYDSRVVKWSRKETPSVNGFPDHAVDLLDELYYNRRDAGALSRPLILVAHSMGGLLCKRALLVSRNHEQQHDIFDSTQGIIFMGTPHRGSWMAKWGLRLASELSIVIPTNKVLLASLRTDSQMLQWIQDDFCSMLLDLEKSRPSFEITCFYEELGMPLGGIVVSKESATMVGYPRYGIHANHRNMVRFASADDPGFCKFLEKLKSLMDAATANGAHSAGQSCPRLGTPPFYSATNTAALPNTHGTNPAIPFHIRVLVVPGTLTRMSRLQTLSSRY